jgi:integrase
VHAQTGLGRDAIRRSEAYTSGVVQVRRFDDLRPTASRTQASHVAENVQRRVATADPQPTHRTRRRLNVAIVAVTVVLLVIDAVALAVAYA